MIFDGEKVLFACEKVRIVRERVLLDCEKLRPAGEPMFFDG